LEVFVCPSSREIQQPSEIKHTSTNQFTNMSVLNNTADMSNFVLDDVAAATSTGLVRKLRLSVSTASSSLSGSGRQSFGSDEAVPHLEACLDRELAELQRLQKKLIARKAAVAEHFAPMEALQTAGGAAVRLLTPAALSNLRRMAHLPPSLHRVATAFAIIIVGEPLAWPDCRKILARPDIDMLLLHVGTSSLAGRVDVDALRAIVDHPLFQPAADRKASASAAAAQLAAWARCVCDVAVLMRNARPLRVRQQVAAARVDKQLTRLAEVTALLTELN
jgi:hypothetical protein